MKRLNSGTQTAYATVLAALALASSLVVSLVVGLTPAQSRAQSLSFEERSRSDFSVKNVKRGSVLYSVKFEKASTLEKAGFGEVLKQLPATGEKTQLLVMKSAVIVNRPVTDFQASSLLSERVIKSLFRLFTVSTTGNEARYGFSRDLTDMAPAFVLRMMGFPLTLKTKCDFDHSINGPEMLNLSGKLDGNLDTPAAAILQTCGDFNLMFTSSTTLSRYYSLDAKRTLAVTLQVARVKQSTIDEADPIPFFSLERTLKDQFKKEVQAFWEALHKVQL